MYSIKPDFKVCMVETKRWSSGFHTYPMSSETIVTWVPESENRIWFYFDMSSAEVKTIGYASGDKAMIKFFNSGLDIYTEMGKVAYGEAFNRKRHRKMFKSIVLGILYGRGVASIANQCEIPDEEAQRLIEVFSQMFPTCWNFIKQKIQYAKNNGEIDTLNGDIIRLRHGDLVTTCGINYFVQNGTTEMLGDGFWMCNYEGFRNNLGSLTQGTIHDSCFGTMFADNAIFMYYFFNSQLEEYIYHKYGMRYSYEFNSAIEFRNHIGFEIEKDELVLNGESIWVEKLAERLLKYNKGRLSRNPSDDKSLGEENAKDPLLGFYNRRNHEFKFDQGFKVYPSKEIRLQIDKKYHEQVLYDVLNKNYKPYTYSNIKQHMQETIA